MWTDKDLYASRRPSGRMVSAGELSLLGVLADLRKADEGLANRYSSVVDDSARNDIACEQRAISLIEKALRK